MKLVTAIVRPEKAGLVIEALSDAGYNAFSKWSVSGRGKQKGIQVGEVFYEEMPKKMLYVAVEDDEKDEVVDIIIHSAKSGEKGSSGDGRIFVADIEEAYTISEQ
nr:P-II family nitrogen regulator [uncultured Cellulosilyticum sp.]